MSFKNAKSFLSLVYDMACQRLKLKRREKIILFRLTAFLIRSDKPFAYSIDKLSERTGYARRSVFESIALLENLRLIERIGHSYRMKFAKGKIMLRICSLVQKRLNNELNKNYTQVQKCTNLTLVKSSTQVQKLHLFLNTGAETAPNRTSLSLEHKEKGIFFSPEELRDFNEYCGAIKSDIRLGLLEKATTPLNITEWINSGRPKKHLECMDKNC